MEFKGFSNLFSLILQEPQKTHTHTPNLLEVAFCFPKYVKVVVEECELVEWCEKAIIW